MGFLTRRFVVVATAGVFAFVAAVVPPLGSAEAAVKKQKKMTCQVIAKHAADDKARGRILKTAMMGGFSALVIGAIISHNNKSGKEMAGGAFGGGVIAGKAYKIRWQKDYNQALAKCRHG